MYLYHNHFNHHPHQFRSPLLLPSCSKLCLQNNSAFIKYHHLIIVIIIEITVITVIMTIILIITIITCLLIFIIFQSGVFMSSQKYQGLLDQVNRQKIAIDNEKVGEMSSHV